MAIRCIVAVHAVLYLCILCPTRPRCIQRTILPERRTGLDMLITIMTRRQWYPRLMSICVESSLWSRTMRDFLGESDHPAQLAQWLTKNREEAKRISRLEPAVAVRALEKVEAKLAAAPKPAPKKVTGATPPVSTVGGGSNASFDPNKSGMDDFAAWRRRQKA